MPILLPSNGQPLRASYDAWMRSQRIHPHIVAEFDDSALMKAFGKAGVGVFMAPSVIESEVQAQYQVSVIGRVREIRAEFFVISADHEVSHPCAVAVVEGARELFSTQD